MRSAPHVEMLDEAAAVVTHCGHGMTIKALAAGVPLVLSADRAATNSSTIAASVVHRGAGLRLDASAEPAAIATATRSVLGETGYREAARQIALVIAQETAEDGVIVEIEKLIGDRQAQPAASG